MVDYKSTVHALNNLQSNAAALQKIVSNKDAEKHLNLSRTINCLNRIGLSIEDLDSLSVIHISGTKGKGSTCAFTESILRAHGYKTGFYSSPHLIEVRERIRINGVPISRERFVSYFWQVHDRLEESKEANDNYMPNYFKFLTVLAFYIFLEEKLDVVVLEVGIGGTYDCTNAVRNPVACGVASLGLDHTAILGKTIEEIASHKAGIIKTGASAFTVPQVDSALAVIQEQSNKVQASLHVTPPLSDYPGTLPELGLDGDVQNWNASLAIQLANAWITKKTNRSNGDQQLHNSPPDKIPTASTFPLNEHFRTGLQNCVWPGRYQTIKYDNVTFYLDGAHTLISIQNAVNWFHNKAVNEAKNIRGSVARILIFNLTNHRRCKPLLQPILNANIDYAVFSPNILDDEGSTPDAINRRETSDVAVGLCNENLSVWMDLHGLPNSIDCTDTVKEANGCSTRSMNEAISIINSIRDAKSLNFKGDGANTTKYDHFQVFATGSLHLVGNILQVLESKVR